MNKIQIENLKKSYNGTEVLKGVSFKVKVGEVVALLGDSGAGKSTLLRCFNLLEIPDEGKMIINHFKFCFSPTEKKPAWQSLVVLRSKVGMVFQKFHLWEHRTVLQNVIEAPCQVLKMPKVQAIENAKTLLDQVGILAKQNEYPRHLSGGQQQRVAIVRALMMKPEVILFDEPTSALDPKMMITTRNLIHKLAQKGVTVVIATHEMKFVREVAHKIVFLHEGRIVEEGQTEKMFHSPETKVFGNFIESVVY